MRDLVSIGRWRHTLFARVLAGVYATVLSVLLLLSLSIPITAVAVEHGQLAPLFELPVVYSPDKPSVTTLGLADPPGKVVYVDFWSAWCAPCRSSLPQLSQLQRSYSTEEFVVLSINLDGRPSTSQRADAQGAQALSILDALPNEMPNEMPDEMPDDTPKRPLLPQNVMTLLKTSKLAFPVVADTDQTTTDHYGVTTLPAGFLVDTHGVIQYVHKSTKPGTDPADLSALKHAVARLVAGNRPTPGGGF